MNFIAETFYLEQTPASPLIGASLPGEPVAQPDNLLDLVAKWEAAFTAADRANDERNRLLKAMEAAGMDWICFATVQDPSGKTIKLVGEESPEDPAIIDEWLGRQRDKYLWNSGQFEQFAEGARLV